MRTSTCWWNNCSQRSHPQGKFFVTAPAPSLFASVTLASLATCSATRGGLAIWHIEHCPCGLMPNVDWSADGLSLCFFFFFCQRAGQLASHCHEILGFTCKFTSYFTKISLLTCTWKYIPVLMFKNCTSKWKIQIFWAQRPNRVRKWKKYACLETSNYALKSAPNN